MRRFSNPWKSICCVLLCVLNVHGGETNNAVDPLAGRCIEACLLMQHATPLGEAEHAWSALGSFSNAPDCTLELFATNGASLYISGNGFSLSEALLSNTAKAQEIYKQMQQLQTGENQFFTWNPQNNGLNQTTVSWLHCSDIESTPIIAMTHTTPFHTDSAAPLAGSWTGAYTEKCWTEAQQDPQRRAGQMSGLFLPLDHQFFFRLYGHELSISGQGVNIHNRLAAVSVPDENKEHAYWYFDGTLDIQSNTLRGRITGAFDGAILERSFFLKKEQK